MTKFKRKMNENRPGITKFKKNENELGIQINIKERRRMKMG